MNDDELKLINQTLSKSFLTDVKYENGKLYAKCGDEKIDLGAICTTSVEPSVSIVYDCDAVYGSSNASQYVTATSCTYTDAKNDTSQITARTAKDSSDYVSNIAIASNYVNHIDTDNSAVLTINPGYLGTLSSSYSVKTDYFLDKDDNSSWIMSLFSSFYVDQIKESLSNKKSKTIEFFGICKEKTKTILVSIDVLQESIKDIFDKASSQAKTSGFSELFGPLTDKITMKTYINAVEKSGKFYKEFYDEKELIELVKGHKLPIKKELASSDKNQFDEDRIKSLEESLDDLRRTIDRYNKAIGTKAPYDLVDEEDEDLVNTQPGIKPWWEVRPQDLPWYGVTSPDFNHMYHDYGISEDPNLKYPANVSYPPFTISCANHSSCTSTTTEYQDTLVLTTHLANRVI